MDAQVKAKPELKVIKEEEIPHLLIPGEVGAILELIVRDKRGKITEKRVLKSESFVRQFLELLWIQTNQIGPTTPYSMRNTANVLKSVYNYFSSFRCDAGSGIVTHGIIVGTGTLAPTINDYALQTPIAHGTAASQLQYSAVTFGAPASDATTSQFTITRNFANGSGAAITVNEIALYVRGYDGADQYFMVIRDVISGGIAVPNGQTLTVNYREQAVA